MSEAKKILGLVPLTTPHHQMVSGPGSPSIMVATHFGIEVCGETFACEEAIMERAKELSEQVRAAGKVAYGLRIKLGEFLLHAKARMGPVRMQVLLKEMGIHRSTAYRSMGMALSEAQKVASHSREASLAVAGGQQDLILSTDLAAEREAGASITQRSRRSVEEPQYGSLRQAEIAAGVRKPLRTEVVHLRSHRSADVRTQVGSPVADRRLPDWAAMSRAGGVMKVDAPGQMLLADVYQAAERLVARVHDLVHKARHGDADAGRELSALMARVA
jgi:hypothetical protein